MFMITTSFKSVPLATFKDDQLRFSRVRTAYTDKERVVKARFKKSGVDFPACDILIRGFKEERELQIWAKNKNATTFTFIKTYDFCMLSGVLGPKTKEGDSQVPEGYYHIDRFNPASSYYLSLGINYPNTTDKKLSQHRNLGGDIFIHGECVSIGCIPITNPLIKELYIMCVEAKSNGQSKIPVHIYPAKLTDACWEKLMLKYADNPELIAHWENLKQGFAHFTKDKTLAKIGTSATGAYTFN
ncbi:MAG: L,D-transpeptidase family protein [Flavobacteriales bacterium]|nr:L,D-transpeptidase family protein [Flavobacteriales bacterium]